MIAMTAAKRGRRGSGLIEFAIALAVIAPVFVGGFQFFAAYQRVEEIQQAAIRGARAAARLPYDSATEAPSPSFRAAGRKLTPQPPENVVTAHRERHRSQATAAILFVEFEG